MQTDHELSDFLYHAFLAIPVAGFIVDSDGRIALANEKAGTLLGYSAETLTTMHFWDFDLHCQSPERFATLWDELKSSEKPSHADSIFKAVEKTMLPVQLDFTFIERDGELMALCVFHDISDRLNSKEELSLLRKLINNSHDMVYILRISDGYIHYCNQTAMDQTGYTLEEVQEIGIEGFRRPMKEGEPFMEHLQELRQKGKMTDYAMLIRKDGTEFPIEANVRVVHYKGEDYNIAIVRDITERARHEEKLRELNASLERTVAERTFALEMNLARLQSYKKAMDSNSIVSISDKEGRISYVNDNFCTVSGYTAQELLGRMHSIVRHPDTPSSVFKELWETITSKRVWQGILKNRKKDGSHYYVDIAILPILDQNSEIIEYIAVRHEITDLIEKKEELRYQLYVDTLTGLGSRLQLLEDVKVHPSPALTYIDIDSFNTVNDFYGLEFGDRLLGKFAKRLSEHFSDLGVLYRLHGDQFAVLSDRNDTERFIESLQGFIDWFNKGNVECEGKELTLRITASYTSEESDRLVATADLARRHAKRENLPLVVFDKELGLEDEIETNMAYALKIQHALSDDRIAVYFQPIVSVTDPGVKKYECLMRLVEEDGKVISPFFFLPTAKRSKQYTELSRTVIEKVFDMVDKHPDSEFSVNITIEDILSEEIVSLIMERLEKKQSAMPVIFELVESEGIENFDEVLHFIKQIKSHGSKLAIDDFGTGYSNFEYLLRLEADYIKIDGSLIRSIDTDDNIRNIIELIVGFAKKQGIATVAEFVSSQSIQDEVEKLGIDYLQGFHLSEPLPCLEV